MTKTCSKCGEIKDVAEFRTRKERTAPNAACRACESKAAMKHAKANPEAKREADKRYAEAHAEQRAAVNREWRTANAAKVRAAGAVRMAEWRAANTERDAANRADWRSRNKDRERGYSHTRRARVGGSNSVYRTITIIGETCSYCPAPATEVDHVWPLSLGGTNDVQNLVPSCLPCNRSKGSKTLAEWLGFTEPE